MSTAMVLGIISGMIIGVAVALILFTICNKDSKIKTEYDERQEQIRGKGFKYGFFTMFGAIIVMIILKAAEINIPIHDAVILFFIMLTGVAEYVTYTIMHDAYFGINNKINSYMLVFALIALVNVLVTVMNAISGELVVDGVLGLNGINMLCAAMFLWIFIVLVIKKLSDERED